MTLPAGKLETEAPIVPSQLCSEIGRDGAFHPFHTFTGWLPVSRLRAWAIRGGASVLQQGLFAGAHFLANILLARWMPPEAYGLFAVAYSFFLLILSLYMALFYEPLLVYGSGRYRKSFSAYVRILARGHFLGLFPVCFLIVLIAPFTKGFYSPEFRICLVALAAACPFLLLVWLFRGVFYAQLNPYAGTVAGAFYFILLLLSVCILRRMDLLSPATALCAIGAVAFLVSAGCWHWIHRGDDAPANTTPKLAVSVFRDHWTYGRWAAVTAITAWIPANIYYALLPPRFGLEATAQLRALMNLMFPLLHSFAALLTLLIPILVKQRSRAGVNLAKRTTLQLIAMYVPVGLVYLIVVVSLRSTLIHLCYAGRYSNVSFSTVFCIAMLPLTTGVSGLLSAALRSFEKPSLVFCASSASSVAALIVGVPLTLHHGTSGAAAAILLNDLPAIAVLSVGLARCRDAGDPRV